MRAGRPQPFSQDRSIQALQVELKQLRRQLSEGHHTTRPTATTKGQESGVGLQTDHHEIVVFPVAATHDHMLLLAPARMRLTEAYWVPEDTYTADNTNFSWLRFEERQQAYNYATSGDGWRRLGYISGELKTAGPWATGDQVAGRPYPVLLDENPIVEKGSLLVCVSEAETIPGAWPDGYVLYSWRYL